MYEPPAEECITCVSTQLRDQSRRSQVMVKRMLEFSNKKEHDSEGSRLKKRLQVQKPNWSEAACICISTENLAKCPRDMNRNGDEPVSTIQGPSRNKSYTAICRPPCHNDFNRMRWH